MKRNSNVRCWDVDRAASLATIGKWCLDARRVNRLLVSVRPYIDSDDHVEFDARVQQMVVEIFGRDIIMELSAQSWPGTELIEHVGKVYVIRFDKRLLDDISKRMDRLDGWRQSNDPALPEDLCLYREGDAWPVLVSVTHDGDAWILDDNPRASFVRRSTIPLPMDLIPPLRRLFVHPSFHDEGALPPGSISRPLLIAE